MFYDSGTMQPSTPLGPIMEIVTEVIDSSGISDQQGELNKTYSEQTVNKRTTRIIIKLLLMWQIIAQ